MLDTKPIAIVPARIGSKRIKHKNIINFKNKPLIYWTINVALKSKIFSKVYVSTDSLIIKNKLKSFKKKIYFLKRPKKYSGDKTQTKTLVKHLILNNLLFEKFNDFFLLQPTSPMRTKNNLIKMWKVYKKNKLSNLASVSFKKNKFKITKSKINLYPKSKKFLKKNIYLTGSIYINNIKKFLKNPDFIKNKNNFYLVKNKYSLDIDYVEDLKKL